MPLVVMHLTGITQRRAGAAHGLDGFGELGEIANYGL
jgi:hypothetical protein